MRYDPQKHHRHAMRLRAYDYTQAGAYFVTIVTDQRELLFDDPVLRRVVETLWQAIPRHFPAAALDEFVVMPNHLHGILWLMGDERRGEAFARESQSIGNPAMADLSNNMESWANASPLHVVPGSLSAIIGNFKSVTTRRINRIRHSPGGVVWQRNFYDRVIRHERELAAVRQYIRDNPANWALDKENPQS
jgi:REP element-mobilizing transposase RayT